MEVTLNEISYVSDYLPNWNPNTISDIKFINFNNLWY